MLKVGFFNGQRLHIADYDPQTHEGKVFCEEGHVLIAKRGEVRIHHFSHRAGEGANCSSSEGKGDWHLFFQSRLLPRSIELRLTRPVSTRLSDGRVVTENLTKIADSSNVIGPEKNILSIVEFQSSVMSASEMQLRETFYSRRDLLTAWGVPDCRSELTWVFNLNNCDIEIAHLYGDLICFEWMKGPKYMLAAKARTFYDLGRRDLIQVLAVHKPDTNHPKFIGRLIPLAVFDKFFFDGVLNCKTDEDHRLNTHPLEQYDPLPLMISDVQSLEPIVEKLRMLFFKPPAKSKLRGLEIEIMNLLTALRQNV
jgi:hypothetical protein